MITIKKIVHVVGAIIENETGKILCALRGPEMTLPNYWEFPGGKIEEGETKKRPYCEKFKKSLVVRLKCLIKLKIRHMNMKKLS